MYIEAVLVGLVIDVLTLSGSARGIKVLICIDYYIV